MSKTNKTISNDFSLLHIILKAAIIGFIWGLADLYIGFFNATLSAQTYLLFFVAYILSCVFIAVLISLVIRKINSKKSLALQPDIFVFMVILFLYSYIIASVKINGWFNLLNIRAIATITLLLAATGILTRLLLKKEVLKNLILSKTGFLQITFLTGWGLTIFSYFFLNFPEVISDKVQVFLYLSGIVILPFFSILLIFSAEKISKKLIKKDFPRGIVTSVVIIFLCFVVPLLLKNPDISKFHTTKHQPKLIASKNKTNVILIVMDTARKDHLSCYGYKRQATPNIDQFAANAVLFNQYISTAPWTIPSHASIFTGMFTSKHGAKFSPKEHLILPMPRECVTLAEVLQQHGWHTIGITANTILNHKTNFDQGFDFYYAKLNEFRDFFWGAFTGIVFKEIWNKWNFLRINIARLSSDINRVVFEKLEENHSDPLFLFINYMEPHHGLKFLPARYNNLYGSNWGHWKEMYDGIDIEEIVYKRKTIAQREKEINDNWLDNKMQFMDFHIGQLFDKLKELMLYQISIIILVSDHGDLFGEHFSFGHSMELYHELKQVPLIIKYPSTMNKTGICNKVVQNVDLMPQILSELGLPIPEDVQGQNFEEINHEIISELFRRNVLTYNKPRYNRDLKAIYDFNQHESYYKYIQSTNGDNELFDIKFDSLELNNILSEQPIKARLFDDRLMDWREAITPISDDSAEPNKLDQKTKDKLRALGYVQ